MFNVGRMRRTFATLALLALAAGTIEPGGVGAAARVAAKPKDPCASQPSKFLQAKCRAFKASAPGDEYFGKMKMSYLGINNTFRDENIVAGAYTVDPGIVSKVAFADDAMRAWTARYPNDPELARSYFLGIGMFKKIYTQQYQDKAWDYMHLIVKRFPSSYFAKQIKKDLSVGFTEHILADALPCPTPLPPGVVPTLLPSAEPSPSPAPGRPKLSMIEQPCIKATPTPSPTPLPTATPTSAPSLSSTPSPVPSATPTPTPTPHP